MTSVRMLQGLCAPSSLSSSSRLSNAQSLPTASFTAKRPAASTAQASFKNGEDSKPLLHKIGSGIAALGLAAALQFSPSSVGPASADEFGVIRSDPPLETHYYDDAGVLSRVTRSDIKRLLTKLEDDTGFHIDMVTIRKLAGKGDVFELADKILEGWYPTLEIGNKRGVVLLITSAKEGAVAGGPAFLESIGDDLLEAVITENLPVLATDEKYNEAIFSTAKRLSARLEGQPDIPGPTFQEAKRESNFKTRQETLDKRNQFSVVVGGLLVIAFVVPMLQYYAYTMPKK